MNTFMLEKRYTDLNNRLRIIMLQNIREEAVNDESVLMEINNISSELIRIKRALPVKNQSAVMRARWLSAETRRK